MDWKNHLENNPIQKIEKKTLNLERKNFTPQNHSLFRSISCFGVTKITTPI